MENTATKFLRLLDGPYRLADKVGKNTFLVYDDTKDKTIENSIAQHLGNIIINITDTQHT